MSDFQTDRKRTRLHRRDPSVPFAHNRFLILISLFAPSRYPGSTSLGFLLRDNHLTLVHSVFSGSDAISVRSGYLIAYNGSRYLGPALSRAGSGCLAQCALSWGFHVTQASRNRAYAAPLFPNQQEFRCIHLIREATRTDGL